jgi:hypothetical protein
VNEKDQGPGLLHVYENQEGTVLYSEYTDPVVIREPLIGYVQMIMFPSSDDNVKAIWRSRGPFASHVQAFAVFFLSNPGLYEAVGGVMTYIRSRHP